MPGMDGTGLLFKPFVQAWQAAAGPAELQVMRYPGDQAWGYDELQRWLQGQLPRHEPLVLLGESFSGPLAVRLAADPRLQVRGLILCASFVQCPRPALRAPAARLPARLLTSRPGIELAQRAILGTRADTGLRDLFAKALEQVSPAVLKTRLMAVMQLDPSVARTWASLQRPTLSLCASRDWLVPASASRAMQRLRPGAGMRWLPAPHGVLQIAPHEAATAVADFVRGLPA
jgi:pimeloyl-ACP methyl ester carboxylesterase